jgi:hypothetical protein
MGVGVNIAVSGHLEIRGDLIDSDIMADSTGPRPTATGGEEIHSSPLVVDEGDA